MTTNNTNENSLEQKISNPRAVFISGASRGIGKGFAEYFAQSKENDVIRISSSEREGFTKLDLNEEVKISEYLKQLNFSQYGAITYIHSIGKDKFEPNGKPQIDLDGDGIDDEVYSSNVITLRNFVEPLIAKTSGLGKPLVLVQIGSISDLYDIPFWQSFSKSKNAARKFLKSISVGNVKSLTLNVSSTFDEPSDRYGRVKADVTYWQSVQELVSKSSRLIENIPFLETAYMEADFFKPNPYFKQDYFTNLPKLFSNWQRDMGYLGKEVPHGIRI